MSDIFFIALRRLRTPLILMVCVYAIATLGMTLIPGVDDQGNVTHMSFFHAFYFVSFMSTTIGFGEIPYAFTDSQRVWVLICIYTSVITWLYAIGNMLNLIQDKTFRHALSQRAFKNSIERIHRPFYIICGYGETGMLVNHGLSEIGIQSVIIDYNEERVSSIELEDLAIMPIALNADITEPQSLLAAGMNHPKCLGLLAVTENDHTNLQIAVSSKLINKAVPVICRSEIQDEADNMESFGTDVIINPYQTFARRINLMLNNPDLYQVHNWFINQHSREHISDKALPKGKWIICGYGRLGQAIKKKLSTEGIEIVLVDEHPEKHDDPDSIIAGRGTEAHTLRQAGISEAALIVAASDDDANNLSILITARQLNSNIYTIGRVSKEANQPLFIHADCDYVMRRSQVVANEALTAISRPLVSKFLAASSYFSDAETAALTEEIEDITKGDNPITTRFCLTPEQAPALMRHLLADRKLTLQQISQHPLFPGSRCIPLLMYREGEVHLMPSLDTELNCYDQLLFCSKRNSLLLAQRLADNDELIDTLINGNPHHIPVFRWLSRRSA